MEPLRRLLLAGSEDGVEERSYNECIEIIQSLDTEVWEELHELESVLPKLLAQMLDCKRETSWRAARLYCTLAGINGSEAHRVCDAEFTRALLQIMRKHYQQPNAFTTTRRSSANSTRARKSSRRRAAESSDDSDFDDEEEETGKRARSTMSGQVARDWKLMFKTMIRLESYLDDLERAEVFIHLAVRLDSKETIDWLSKHGRGGEYLLQALLKETVANANGNTLEKETSAWLMAALRSLTSNAGALASDYLVLAFCQRLILQCEVSTQAQRTKLVEFLQDCCCDGTGTGADGESKKRMETFVCLESFHAHIKASKRLLACELVALFASGSKPCASVLHVLCQRTRDSVASVRCAAFRSLCQLAQTHNVLLTQNEHVLAAALEAARFDIKPVVRRWAIKMLQLVPEFNMSVIQCCMERLKDVSPICRKAALDTLGSILNNQAFSISAASVAVFHKGVLLACLDEDASIRKQALELCRALLCTCADADLFQYLYAVRTPVEMQCLRLALAPQERSMTMAQLRDLQERMMRCAIETLPSEDSAVDRPMIWSAWLVLEITFTCSTVPLPSEKVFSSDFLFTAWQRVRDMLSLSELENNNRGVIEAHALQQRVCKLLALCASRLTLDQKNELGNMLLGDLSDLTRVPLLISEMLNTLVVLSEFDVENYREIISDWSSALKQMCEQYLLEPEKEASKVGNALFMLGELALLSSKTLNDAEPYFRFAEEDPCTTLIQAFCSPDFVENHVSSRAFALVSLGKLCLRDAVLAKRCMVLFVKQLAQDVRGSGELYILRCNVLTILGDLGRKYTNLIEPFVDEQIAQCLGDGNAQVRFRCLQMLANLLSEEYVKMRPRLFYRLLACVADEDQAIAALATQALAAFHTKEPTTFFHLAGSGMILAMNDQANLIEDGETVLVGVQRKHLSSNAAARMQAYTFVVSKLSEVQLVEASNKIRRDVWGALLDGTIGLDRVDLNQSQLSNASRICLDVFALLEQVTRATATISANASKSSEEFDEDDLAENDAPPAPSQQQIPGANKAMSKVLDSLERSNMVNNVLPTLISLYQVSSREKSSLVKPILGHLEFLLERFRQECSTALAPHRDIQALLRMKRQASANNAASTPVAARRKRTVCALKT